jgi:hypothetical protein
MSKRRPSLKQALTRIAGDDYDRLTVGQAKEACRWLLAQARDGTVFIRGIFPGKFEASTIDPEWFIKPPVLDLDEDTLTWRGDAVLDTGASEGTSGWVTRQAPIAAPSRSLSGMGISDAQHSSVFIEFAERMDAINPSVTVRNVIVDGATLKAALEATPGEQPKSAGGPGNPTGPKRKSISDAIAELILKMWPDGIPDGLKEGERNARIGSEAKAQGFSTVCNRTIETGVQKSANLRNAGLCEPMRKKPE